MVITENDGQTYAYKVGLEGKYKHVLAECLVWWDKRVLGDFLSILNHAALLLQFSSFISVAQ